MVKGKKIFREEVSKKIKKIVEENFCKNNPKNCREKDDIINYAFYLIREFVKKIKHREFYLNNVNFKRGEKNYSKFLLSLSTRKNGPQVAFLFKICIPANKFQKGFIDLKCPLANCKSTSKNNKEKKCKLSERFLKKHKINKSNLTYKFFDKKFISRTDNIQEIIKNK